MFNPEVYIERRKKLKEKLDSGIILFPGNDYASMNYPSNTYHFRQDSNFLYFFGLNQAGLMAVIDLDEDKEILFGNDVDMDDIIWMGFQPSIRERAKLCGVENTDTLAALETYLKTAVTKGRQIHFTPPYRCVNRKKIEYLTGIPYEKVNSSFSVPLVKAIVSLRSIKEDREIEEIEKALDTAYEMHTTAMKMARPGIIEKEIAGVIEGIALSRGGSVSFPVILSVHGETLHNHYHGNTLKEGDLLVTDAGAETEMNYCSDITRTIPVSGRFTSIQKDIYQIVLEANTTAISHVKPGITNLELHLMAARTIVSGLKEIGLMKGDVDEAVAAGAHALFFPHGLGHMMGLDVHDMEDLGEDYVGYDDNIKRSKQFGLAFLRLARELQPGFVFTIEPGIYFIPALIDLWKSEKKHTEFINYNEVGKYKDFGGIRIEDDILVTPTGHRVLGRPIPKTIEEIEGFMKS